MTASSLGGFVFCILVAGVSAQKPEFDVATVKAPPTVALGTAVSINLGTFRNGSLAMTNVTLSECLQFAYALASQDQIAGPDWIKVRDTRFDIVAKTDADTDLDRARGMLRTLLAERLKLVVHTEQRPFSLLALVPAKNGPKLVASPAIALRAAARGRSNRTAGTFSAEAGVDAGRQPQSDWSVAVCGAGRAARPAT